MDEPLKIPIELSGADRANLELDQILGSFTKLERQTIELATANERSAQRFNELIAAFRDGHITGDQLRATLAQVAEQAPRTAAEIRKVAEAEGQVAAVPSGPGFVDRWSSYATALSSTINVAQSAYATFDRVASSIAAMSAEQDMLSRNSARMGLDFDVASAAAGRFVDETVASAAAARLFEAGIHVTQEQLNALMRVSGEYAQATGGTVTDAVNSLTNGLINGSARGLRPFGEEMAAVSGASHTAEERLAALTSHAESVDQATDSAATRMERFRDSIGDQMRTASSAFTTNLQNIQERADAARESITGVTGEVRDLKADMDALGSTAAYMWGLFSTAADVALTSVVNNVSSVADGLRLVGQLMTQPQNAGALIDAYTTRQQARANETAGSIAAFNAVATDPYTSRTGGGPTGAAASGGVAGRSATGYGHDDLGSDFDPASTARGSARTHYLNDPLAMRRDAARRGRGGRGRRDPNSPDYDEAAAEKENAVRAAIDSERAQDDATYDEGAADKANGVRQALAANDNAVRRASTRRGPGGAPGDALDAAAARRQQERAQRELDAQVDAQKTFVDRMEEQHHRHVDVVREAAESLDAAFKGIGDAISAHVVALAAGQETAGQFAEGIAASSLAAISKESQGKAAFYTAEALGLLVSGNFAGAGTAGLAAGAYLVAAGTTAYLAGQAAPAPASHGGGASSGGGSARHERLGPDPRPVNDNAAPQQVFHFYAPVIGGREAAAYEVGARMGRFTDATGERQARART